MMEVVSEIQRSEVERIPRPLSSIKNSNHTMIVSGGNRRLWHQAVSAAINEGFNSTDVATIRILPNQPNTIAFFAVTPDGNYQGCSVTTHNGVFTAGAWVMVAKEARGRGICNILANAWRAKRDEIGNLPHYGKAVPNMLASYMSPPENASPLQKNYYSQLNKEQIDKLIGTPPIQSQNDIRMISGVSAEIMASLIEYDAEMTGLPRATFLNTFFMFPETEGFVAVNPDGEVIGYTAVVPYTGNRSHCYKLAPLMAQDWETMQLLMKAATDHVNLYQPKALFGIRVIEGTAGDQLRRRAQKVGINFAFSVTSTITLSGKPLVRKFKNDEIYAPFDSFCSFDM